LLLRRSVAVELEVAKGLNKLLYSVESRFLRWVFFSFFCCCVGLWLLNMAWKLTPEAWIKGVWWNMRREIDRRKYEGKSNPLVPYEIVKYIHATLKEFKASFEQSPAVLARGTPMNPAGEANEDWARTPPRSKTTPTLQNGEEASQSSTRTTLYPILL